MSEFKGKQISRINSIELNGSIEEVFPLFTPIEEMKWAKGWEPTVIYPANEEVKEGMVFKSRHTDEHLTFWVITEYKPEEHYIQYVNFTYDYRGVVLKIKCNQIAKDKTEAVIHYTYTGLSEKGNEFIEGMTEQEYEHYALSWQRDINNYLKNNN